MRTQIHGNRTTWVNSASHKLQQSCQESPELQSSSSPVGNKLRVSTSLKQYGITTSQVGSDLGVGASLTKLLISMS
jgi:hypothetical protein